MSEISFKNYNPLPQEFRPVLNPADFFQAEKKEIEPKQIDTKDFIKLSDQNKIKPEVVNKLNFVDDEPIYKLPDLDFQEKPHLDFSYVDKNSFNLSLPRLFDSDQKMFQVSFDEKKGKVGFRLNNDFRDTLLSPVKGFIQENVFPGLPSGKSIPEEDLAFPNMLKSAAAGLATLALVDNQVAGKLIKEKTFNQEILNTKVSDLEVKMGLGINYDGTKKGIFNGDSNISVKNVNASFKSREFLLAGGEDKVSFQGRIGVSSKGKADSLEFGTNYRVNRDINFSTIVSHSNRENKIFFGGSIDLP